MLSLFFMLALSNPYLVINLDSSDSFHRIIDVAIDEHGHIYTLDRDEGAIQEHDPTGVHLRQIGSRGQGPGEVQLASALAYFGGKLWLVDGPSKAINLYQDGKFKRRITEIDNPHSLAIVGDRLVVAPIHVAGVFHVFDQTGDEVAQFKIENTDWAVSPNPDPRMVSLWRMVKIAPLQDGSLAVGLANMERIAKINQRGGLETIWDGDRFLFRHPRKTARYGKIPEYFSSTAHELGPDGLLWFAASEENNHSACTILYKLDIDHHKVIERLDMGEHIRTIRYVSAHQILALVRGDDRVELYKTTTK